MNKKSIKKLKIKFENQRSNKGEYIAQKEAERSLAMSNVQINSDLLKDIKIYCIKNNITIKYFFSELIINHCDFIDKDKYNFLLEKK